MNRKRTKSQTDNKIRLGNGKVVGQVVKGEFRKRISGSKHFLRIPAGIALEVSSIDDAEAVGAKMVRVTDKETKNEYWAMLATIREKGIPINRGHGDQIALPFKFWKPTKTELLTPPKPIAPKVKKVKTAQPKLL